MGQDEQAKLIPSDRVEEIVQAVKDMTSAPYFKLGVNEGRTPGLTDTKLGGLPYWPAGKPYPETKKGMKLMLLAQLDLADFGGDERLPGRGLLQFFIDSDDDCSGLDFDDGTNQNGFRVVWDETVDSSVTPEDVRALGVPTSLDSWDDRIGNPLRGEFALDVEAGTQWMTPADELLYEEDLILEKALAESGRPYRFCSWPEKANKLGHAFNVLFPELEESREANRAIADYFRAQG